MDAAIAVPVAFFITVIACVVGLPMARAFARKLDRESAPPRVPPDVAQRLERIEQAVDAIAVEVERISEGQRFTTKLLAERTREGSEALPSAAPERR